MAWPTLDGATPSMPTPPRNSDCRCDKTIADVASQLVINRQVGRSINNLPQPPTGAHQPDCAKPKRLHFIPLHYFGHLDVDCLTTMVGVPGRSKGCVTCRKRKKGVRCEIRPQVDQRTSH